MAYEKLTEPCFRLETHPIDLLATQPQNRANAKPVLALEGLDAIELHLGECERFDR